MTPLRRASGLLLALAWAAASTGACAQVWGYVDDRGVAHFAPEQVDERYELFHSGEAQARSLSYFEVSPHYKAVRHILRDAAHQHGLAPELLQAMVAAESGFDAKAVSPRGAVGLMQITPIAAQEVGLKVPVGRAVEDLLIDPHINLHTGAKVLARLFTLFPDRLDLIVAAYNAGEGAVRRAGTQVPDIPETRQYVQTVLRLYRDLLPPKAVQQARLRDRHTPFRQP
ncbi:MAG TPA: lytic transglycosylase domain-containing protein [Burkholderiaceae bacterium]|nr:lytic transglycosylase domain-containing protein [Burkholderiaceae bacterium]